jgi:hypothetical protein
MKTKLPKPEPSNKPDHGSSPDIKLVVEELGIPPTEDNAQVHLSYTHQN